VQEEQQRPLQPGPERQPVRRIRRRGSSPAASSGTKMEAYLQEWEHDACALMAVVSKDGKPSHSVIRETLHSLALMVHRSGDVDGEGDGCGLQIDLPRRLWARDLADAGHDSALAWSEQFAVGHFFIPGTDRYWSKALKEQLLQRLELEGIQVLLARAGRTAQAALGPRGRQDEPEFWQVAALVKGETTAAVNQKLFDLTLAVEEETSLHVVSWSSQSVVYKVRGDARTIAAYYPDLADPLCESRAAIGHNRYSTNTSTAFERVQPFTALGHNGEINTIRQLRAQTAMLGIPLTAGGSDSQDLNRAIEGLIHRYGLTLFEAMEIIFPPIIGESRLFSTPLQDLYMYYRQAWGPFAQGPAAIAARSGDYMVFAVDAMGLRPFWMVEADDLIYFSSEQGIVPTAEMLRDPKPLAPGEKVGVLTRPGARAEVLAYSELQQRVLKLSRDRVPEPENCRRFLSVGGPDASTLDAVRAEQPVPPYLPLDGSSAMTEMDQERLMAALGWGGEDLQLVRAIASNGAEPIGSLGFDGPLACLSTDRVNLADYFKESVAVVTNPAVDREREIEHFSTRVVLGARPPLVVRSDADRVPLYATRIEMRCAVLLGGHRGASPVSYAVYRDIARNQGVWLLEDLLREFDPLYGPADSRVVRHIATAFPATESLAGALSRITAEAVEAVRSGAQVLVVDDAGSFGGEKLWIDPHLAISAIDLGLKRADGAVNPRRLCTLILRSGALRSLHDLVLALGMGADAVNPYMMLEIAAGEGDQGQGIEQLIAGLQKGMEKVISTLGIHEFRGYGRLFSSIGLKPEVAKYFDCVNYCGSPEAGLGFARLKADSGERYRIARGDGPPGLARTFHFWPRVWKLAGEASLSPEKYAEYVTKVRLFEKENPVSLRQLLAFREAGTGALDPRQVDTKVEDYTYPITISGMSFGSQGEIAFRSYAEAAKRLDIVCMNGEGGEIPDMVGRYFKWRGQQVASGRFGVHAEMLAGSRFIEIKVGQGAKPGEGGHLPGSKVSAKVAKARNATQGVDLISPSNNHDVYSIEDLAQLVEELKTVNPDAKLVVKVPVVPGIGTIAVGIAKSGADVIALCGYDGGTGAARKHALKHAGLPIEIGVREAHLALIASGIRDRVELWADGGMKTGYDAVKLILMGANRVGFATAAMVSIGCTICRLCQTDTCHVGIATQMETMEEARHKGLKSFIPRVYEEAVDRLVTLFTCIGEEIRRLTAALGAARTQELVGRVDLLEQVAGLGRVDLAELLSPVHVVPVGDACGAPVRRVENPLTREIALVAAGRLESGETESFSYRRDGVTARDRILGTYLSGTVARYRIGGARSGGRQLPEGWSADVEFADSVAGNGFAAFNTWDLNIRVRGGAQDGVGKGMLGGKVVVLKSRNRFGGYVGGCVGKSFAYGAQRGLFIVQGDADARFGIRFSGADLVIGSKLKGPVNDSLGCVGTRANIKGFAFEYMTMGRAVVLGDPGPWICSGMTGGVVYIRLQPDLGLDEAAIKRRLAKAAKVYITRIGQRGKKDLTELLSAYHKELLDDGQEEEAAELLQLLLNCESEFIAIIPVGQQADPTISTE
jgi:glutamate synthase (NADPH) large chain